MSSAALSPSGNRPAFDKAAHPARPPMSANGRPASAHRLAGQDTVRFGLMAPGNAVINGFYDEDIANALAFVAENHGPQNRPGTDIPYLSHVLGVADIALRYARPLARGSDLVEAKSDKFPEGIKRKDVFIAALLHDLIEDQGGKKMEEEIRKKFGETVTCLVLYCSDLKDQAPAGIGYNARKRLYLNRIAAGPASAMLISGADKLHNLQAGVSEYLEKGEKYWKNFGPAKAEKLQYYKDVIDIFGATGKQPALVRMIDLTYNQLLGLVAERKARPKTWRELLQQAIATLFDAVILFLKNLHTRLKAALFPAAPPVHHRPHIKSSLSSTPEWRPGCDHPPPASG